VTEFIGGIGIKSQYQLSDRQPPVV
jgi:hypothetical protein